MRPIKLQDTKTGLYVAKGNTGDTEPTWVESWEDAWVTTHVSSYTMVQFSLMRLGYHVQALREKPEAETLH